MVIGGQHVLNDAIQFTQSKLTLNKISDVTKIKGKYGIIDLIDLDNIKLNEFIYGQVNTKTGQASLDYIHKGIKLAIAKEIDDVVTGPIHKELIKAAGSPHAGHTEIFATRTNTNNYAMMLTGKHFKVIHVINTCIFA